MKKELVLLGLIGMFLILGVGIVSAFHTECDDGIDNDGDGGIDFLNETISICGAVPCVPACSNGIDDDSNGLIDFPEDAGCASPDDNSETPHDPNCVLSDYFTERAECDDGIDNDGDGSIDLADPDCALLNDTLERPIDLITQCNDGIDNDGNGLTDALVELDSFNLEIFLINGTLGTCNFVATKDPSVTTCNEKRILLSNDAPWTQSTSFVTCNSPVFQLHSTVRKVCELAGYRDFYNYSSYVPPDNGRCNFDSPGSNTFWFWDEISNGFLEVSANPKNDKRYISSLICINRIPECSDGIDNDNPPDGLIDFPDDPGCFSPNDENETLIHDPGCSSPTDPIEDPCVNCVIVQNSPNYCDANNNVMYDVVTDASSCLPACGFSSSTVPTLVQDCTLTGEICLGATCIAPIIGGWANMNRIPIGGGQAILTANINDTVLMIYSFPALIKGSSVTFEVYEDDLLFDDEIRTINTGNEIIGTVIEDGLAIAKWTITDIDYGKSLDHGEFIFVVNTIASNALEILSTEDNSFPLANIDFPVKESKYVIQNFSTLPISFNHTSSDEDDDLQTLWEFGDLTSSNLFYDCLTTGDCNTTHIYSKSGTKIIKINSEEMSRDQFETNCTRIYTYKNGSNIFAIIDSPPLICQNNVVSIPSAGAFTISGVSSFASECYQNQVDCTDPSCGEVMDTAGGPSIWCYLISDSSGLLYQWTIDGVIQTGQIDNTPFNKIFIKAGKHDIDLKVSIVIP